MSFYIREKWVDTLVIPLCMLLINPLFSAAGMQSPLQSNGIWGIILFVATTWGIAIPLSSAIKLLLGLFGRKFFRFSDDKNI